MKENKQLLNLASKKNVTENLGKVYSYMTSRNSQIEELVNLKTERNKQIDLINKKYNEEKIKIEEKIEKSQDSKEVISKIKEISKILKISNEQLCQILTEKKGEQYNLRVVKNLYTHYSMIKDFYEVSIFLVKGDEKSFDNVIEKFQNNKTMTCYIDWEQETPDCKVIKLAAGKHNIESESEADKIYKNLKNTNWVRVYLSDLLQRHIQRKLTSGISLYDENKETDLIKKVVGEYVENSLKIEEKE